MTEAARADVGASSALDQLTGEFASSIARLDSDEIDAAIADVLEQIGRALDADQVTVSGKPIDGDARIVLRSWTRRASSPSGDNPSSAIVVAQGHACSMSIAACRSQVEWPSDVPDRLRLLTNLMELGLERAGHVRELKQERFGRAQAVRSGDLDEGDAGDFEDIIGESPALRGAIARCQEVAPTDATVVLLGETGTGKELFARAVHRRSARRDAPFVRVNCAALPPTLIESELFGHERGAFTGAIATRQGRFELAHRGTIFLDEIGDLPLDVQAKLLRVLQEGELERVGSSHTRRVDVRVVAATHHDLEAAVRDGVFRADLYYRLNVYPITLPPLRQRTEDIPRLIWFFINRRQRALNRKIARVPATLVQVLQQHAWPGNVRELENVIERAMIHSSGDTLRLDEPPGLSGGPSEDGFTLEVVERRHIESALFRSGWRINGAGNAAEQLGLHPNTLRFRMKKLGIRRPAIDGVPRPDPRTDASMRRPGVVNEVTNIGDRAYRMLGNGGDATGSPFASRRSRAMPD
jgi:transcriptional regulator with GAF, ATPase, and Fis domain